MQRLRIAATTGKDATQLLVLVPSMSLQPRADRKGAVVLPCNVPRRARFLALQAVFLQSFARKRAKNG
jgi:hypothetical protein